MIQGQNSFSGESSYFAYKKHNYLDKLRWERARALLIEQIEYDLRGVFHLCQRKNASCDSLSKDAYAAAYAAAWSRVPHWTLITQRPAPAQWFSLFTGQDTLKMLKALWALML